MAGVISRDTEPVQKLLGQSAEARILERLGAIESELWEMRLESESEDLARQVRKIVGAVNDLENELGAVSNDLDAVSRAVGADSVYTPTVLEDVQSIKTRLNL